MKISLFPRKLGMMTDKAHIAMLDGQLREARAEIVRLRNARDSDLHEAIRRGDVA